MAATRQLVRDIRSASSSDAVLRTDAAQLNSAIRLGARFIDGFRGRVVVRPSDVLGEISLPVPWWNEQKWLNISGRAPAFEGSLVLSQVTVGSSDLPPAFALAMARIGANLSLGNHVGDKVLNAASAMQISEDDLIFRGSRLMMSIGACIRRWHTFCDQGHYSGAHPRESSISANVITCKAELRKEINRLKSRLDVGIHEIRASLDQMRRGQQIFVIRVLKLLEKQIDIMQRQVKKAISHKDQVGIRELICRNLLHHEVDTRLGKKGFVFFNYRIHNDAANATHSTSGRTSFVRQSHHGGIHKEFISYVLTVMEACCEVSVHSMLEPDR